MSVVNLREKSINAKVVYYGPPLGGKTTSLKYIHRVMDPEQKSQLVSLNTERDRTLFFDFLPINLGRIGDFSLKIQGFTVPGQVKYLLTRRYVLRGADAVVFVADSRRVERQHNEQSLRDLKDNLRLNGLSYETLPMVLEYNKRDEEDLLSLEEMDESLNDRKMARFETVATVGTGVFEAFVSVVLGMVDRICTEYRIGGTQGVASAVESTLWRIHRTAMEIEAARVAAGGTAAPPKPDDSRGSSTVVEIDDSEHEDPYKVSEALLERAVGTTMQVSELLTEVQESRAALESRVAEMTALYEVAGAAASVLDEDRVVAAVVEGAARALKSDHASMLLRDEDGGTLRERGVHGFLYDPMLPRSGPLPAYLERLLQSRSPVVVTDLGPEGVLEAIRRREPEVRAAVVAPLRLRDSMRGLLTVYFRGPGRDPGESAERFLAALGASATVALENARLHGKLERFNRELEQKVADRTKELQVAYEELKALDRLKDDFLSTMSHELMTPLAGIRSSAEILRSYTDMGPEERGEFVGGIEHEAQRLTSRLQDILDLSALDGGKVVFEKTPAVAREVVQESIQRMEGVIRAADVQVHFWPATGLPRLPCDRRWLDRALDHLIENAAKFSPPKGQIDITLEADGESLRIGVRDRGPGIPLEERNSLFERFKQRGQVLTGKTPGIGAGLPLCRRIAEGHGGSIGIDGGPGRGTQVWIRLPLK